MIDVPAAEPAVTPPPRPEPVTLEFTGTGPEYFRIWIVNVTLTVVTLGVYSAWAKVRRQQFFARHTRLADAGFDYHGPPMAILRGRAVAVVLFGGYSLAGYWSPLAALIAFGVLAAVMPWLLCRSLRFRARNTSYRGLRFRFEGRAQGAYGVFLGLPLAAFFTLMLLGPYWHHQMRRYQHDNAGLGRARFTFHAPVWGFYSAYLQAFVLVWVYLITAAVVLGIAGGLLSFWFGGPADPLERGLPFYVIVATVAVIYVTGFVAVQSLVSARVQNVAWTHTMLDGHRFVYRLSFRRLFAIRLTNLLAIIATLGLFRPFAQVRLARYFASTFTLVPAGPIEDIRAVPVEDIGAVGEEAADLFDFDIAL